MKIKCLTMLQERLQCRSLVVCLRSVFTNELTSHWSRAPRDANAMVSVIWCRTNCILRLLDIAAHQLLVWRLCRGLTTAPIIGAMKADTSSSQKKLEFEINRILTKSVSAAPDSCIIILP